MTHFFTDLSSSNEEKIKTPEVSYPQEPRLTPSSIAPEPSNFRDGATFPSIFPSVIPPKLPLLTPNHTRIIVVG